MKTIKSIKSVGKRKVYDISVGETQNYILENGIVSHNTGAIYCSDTILFVGKSQEKDSDGIQGYNFNLTIEKSRFVKEKSKIPVTVRYDSGIDKFSGLLDLAVEGGYAEKSGNGFIRPHIENDPKFYFKKATQKEIGEWWKEVLVSTDFKQFIESKYALEHRDMFKEEEQVENQEMQFDPETGEVE